MPLGVRNSIIENYLFVIVLLVITLAALLAVVRFYEPILNWCLENKRSFLMLPVITILIGLLIWQGFPKIFGFIGDGAEEDRLGD